MSATDHGEKGTARSVRHPNPGRVFGPLILTTCIQGGGHPWVDQGRTVDAEGREYRARAIKPSLRRQRDRRSGRAFVIGWRHAR